MNSRDHMSFFAHLHSSYLNVALILLKTRTVRNGLLCAAVQFKKLLTHSLMRIRWGWKPICGCHIAPLCGGLLGWFIQ